MAYDIGWTIFDQIYLFNGTWFIVSDRPHKIPLLRLMTSTGNEIWNDEESTAGRSVLYLTTNRRKGSLMNQRANR